MKLLSLLVLFFGGLNAVASTNYSKYISDLQSKFGDLNPEKKIVYLDRDQLEYNFSKNKVSKSKIIQNFVLKTSNQTITINDAETLLFAIDFNNYSAYPLKDTDGKKICVVVPSNPNYNQIQSNLRMLNWDMLHEKPEYLNKTIQNPLPRDVMNLLSDIHETFHCLDNEYLPKALKSHDDFHSVHKSEVFAEVGALLYLKKMGYEGINNKRADLREVGTTLSSKYIAKNIFSPGPWGAIYSLQFAIRSIDTYVANETLNLWDIQELSKFAQAITEIESLNSHEFYGIQEHQEDPVNIQQVIKKQIQVEDFPYLKKRFQIIDRIIKKYKASYPMSLDSLLISTSTNHSNEEQVLSEEDFKINIHCSKDLENIDKSELDNYIDQLRDAYYQLNSHDKGLDYLRLQNIYKCYSNNK